MDSQLIGKVIEYSVTKEKTSTGVVVDKVDMKNKPEDTYTVTGYLIEDDSTGKIVPVAYWRILSYNNEDQISIPKKNVRGGWNPETRSAS